jgi:hypothetical protein
MNPDTSPTYESILSLEREYWRLVSIGDVEGYLAFWKPGAIAWPPGLEAPSPVHSPDLKAQEAEDAAEYGYDYRPMGIQITGSVAVAHFEVTVIERASDHPIATAKGVHVWMKEDDRWQLVSGMGA